MGNQLPHLYGSQSTLTASTQPSTIAEIFLPHILLGQIVNGRAEGFHATILLRQGFIRHRIIFNKKYGVGDAYSGTWQDTKLNVQHDSSFFPDAWSVDMLFCKLQEAYANKKPIDIEASRCPPHLRDESRVSRGTTSEGIIVEFVERTNSTSHRSDFLFCLPGENFILTCYPIVAHS